MNNVYFALIVIAVIIVGLVNVIPVVLFIFGVMS